MLAHWKPVQESRAEGKTARRKKRGGQLRNLERQKKSPDRAREKIEKGIEGIDQRSQTRYEAQQSAREASGV